MKDKSKAEWLTILSESHALVDSYNDEQTQTSRLEYLASAVFGINTYDGEMDGLLSAKAVEVCHAVSGKTTFEYIKDPDKYQWYLIMCHLPFFADRIEWGSSIRGAWWTAYEGIAFESCLLFDGDSQLHEPIKFTERGWEEFIDAVVEYGLAVS